MSSPTWYAGAALSAAAATMLVVAAHAGQTGPAQAPAAQPAALLPSLPLPSVALPPLPLPSLPLPPLPPIAPTRSTHAPVPRPTGPAPSTTSPAGVPPAAGEPGNGTPAGGTMPPVTPATAAGIILTNPAADLYPQPTTDAATTPQARWVAALLDVEHRMQYLNNILARTAGDLARAERQPDPVPHLIMSLTAPAPAPGGPAGTHDTPSGRVLALSAALDSGRAELARREQDAQVLQQAITTVVQPAVAATPAPSTAATGYAGGALPWPIHGRLTSGFGNRFDPYYHVWQLHPGIDIAAPIGTPIAAVAGGRVTQAGWFGGYGNYTCIDHGRVGGQRLSTCYGHQSRILVSPGQLVRAGQVIGAVGSTGASTGPHLHFEVRLGGRPVNPLPWLARSP